MGSYGGGRLQDSPNLVMYVMTVLSANLPGRRRRCWYPKPYRCWYPTPHGHPAPCRCWYPTDMLLVDYAICENKPEEEPAESVDMSEKKATDTYAGEKNHRTDKTEEEPTKKKNREDGDAEQIIEHSIGIGRDYSGFCREFRRRANNRA